MSRSRWGTPESDWQTRSSNERKKCKKDGDETVAVLVRPSRSVEVGDLEAFLKTITPLPSWGARSWLLEAAGSPVTERAVEIRILPKDRKQIELAADELGVSVKDRPGFSPEVERQQRRATPRPRRGGRGRSRTQYAMGVI